MEFGLLIEYNIRNIFFEKSCIKYGGEASLRPFYEKSKLSLSLDRRCRRCYKVCFHCMFKSRSPKIY